MKTLILSLLTTGLLWCNARAQQDLLALTEYTRDGKAIELSPGQYRHQVDLHSAIEVRIAPSALALDDRPVFDTPESRTLRYQLAELDELFRVANRELDRLFKRVQDPRVERIARNDPRIEAQLLERLPQMPSLPGALIPYVRTDRLPGALWPAATADGNASGEAFAPWINHLERVQEDVVSELQRLSSNDAVVLRAWCLQETPTHPPRAVHLNNFDALDTGILRTIDQTVVARSPEEHSHVLESRSLLTSLDVGVRRLAGRAPEVRALARELQDLFLRHMRAFQLAERARAITGQIDRLAAMLEGTPNLDPEWKATFTRLRLGTAALAGIQSTHDLVLADLRTAPATDPFAFFSRISQHAESLARMREVLGQVETIRKVEENRGLLQALGAPDDDRSPSLNTETNRLIGLLSGTWLTSESERTRLFKAAEQWPALLTGLSRLTDTWTFLETLQNAQLSDVPPLPEEERATSPVLTTLIDLPATQPSENDTYSLHLEVAPPNGPVMQRTYTFRTGRYGVYSRWTTNLIMARGQWSRAFQPGTSVSWILHRRNRPSPENGRGGGGFLGDVLNAGIGLNSVLFSTSSNLEYGLGISVSLFNDLLQVGYGFNFQRRDRQGYLFIGASLFDFLNLARRND